MASVRAKVSNGDLSRPPSVHSLKTALASLNLPSMPPTIPLPPLPTYAARSASNSWLGTPITPVTPVTPATPASPDVSFTSIYFRPNNPAKYGTGKYSHIELVPQPSDDPEDPLNWPQWKKDLCLASLLFVVGLAGAMKTAFISANADLAVHFEVSYMSVAALTAVPLMLSGLSGLLASVLANFWGKRPVYLASSVLLFMGCFCNALAGNSYSSCMGARVLQGLGWGVFDTLVMETIHEIYYEHERNVRISLQNILTIGTTWGSPLVGGAISSAHSPLVQYTIIAALFIIAFPLLVLCVPESAFDRFGSVTATASHPVLPWSGSILQRNCRRLKNSSITSHGSEMNMRSFKSGVNLSTIRQTSRALVAPTTILVFFLTVIPYCALWGFAASLCLLLAPAPFSLGANVTGTVMTGPWILPSCLVAAFFLYRSVYKQFSQCASNVTVAGGTILAFVGLLCIGLYIHIFLLNDTSDGIFLIPEAANELSLPLLSFQLGLLASGSAAFDATTRILLARSASFTASSMAVAQRSVGDMNICVIVMRNFVAGAFVLAVPFAATSGSLKALFIGLSVTQAVIAVGVLALWHFCNEAIWRIDGRVMGLMDMRILRLSCSFFETD